MGGATNRTNRHVPSVISGILLMHFPLKDILVITSFHDRYEHQHDDVTARKPVFNGAWRIGMAKV